MLVNNSHQSFKTLYSNNTLSVFLHNIYKVRKEQVLIEVEAALKEFIPSHRLAVYDGIKDMLQNNYNHNAKGVMYVEQTTMGYDVILWSTEGIFRQQLN